MTNCIVDVLDHDKGVFRLAIDRVVEGKEGVAEEVVLLVEHYGGLIGGEHVQVANFDICIKVIALHVIEKRLEEQRGDAIAAKFAMNTEWEDVSDSCCLGRLERISRENHSLVFRESRPSFELSNENSDNCTLIDGRYADKTLRCRDIDVPKIEWES